MKQLSVLMLNGSPRVGGNTSLALGKEQYDLPEREPRTSTNFIQ